jgi:hypothetical protein
MEDKVSVPSQPQIVNALDAAVIAITFKRY